MQRLKEWPEFLADYLRSAQDCPFQWGQNDCCLFAAGAVEAMTGTDFAHGFRGEYSTAREAARILDSFGGISALGDFWLAERVDVLLLGRGDIAAINTPHGLGLGVVGLDGLTIIALSEGGLCRLPLRAVHGWKVG